MSTSATRATGTGSKNAPGKKTATRNGATNKSTPAPAVPEESSEQARARLRAAAKDALGLTVSSGPSEPLRRVIRETKIGYYPIFALCALVLTDQLQGYAFYVLGPDISSGLGISKAALAGLSTLKILAITIATLPTAAFVQRFGRRAGVSIVNGLLWSFFTLTTGLVNGTLTLALVLAFDGLSTGTATATHMPLVMDTHPPSIRVRVMAMYRGAEQAGNVIGPASVALLATVAGFSWRGVFLILGLVSFSSAILSLKLRDPGVGRWDTDRVRETIDGADELKPIETIDLGFFEIVRRLVAIPTVRRILAAGAVLGIFIVPLNTFFFFYLEERWGLGPGGRGLFFAVLPFFSMAAFVLLGRTAEARFQTDPAKFVRSSAALLAVGTAAVPVAVYSPWIGGLVLLFGIATAAFSLLVVSLTMTLLSIVPAAYRPHAAAVYGIFTTTVGGIAGVLLLGGIENVFGTTGAIGFLIIPGLASAAVLRTAARTVDDDFDRMLDELVEEEELRVLHHRGAHLPLLTCRNIDFSYSRLQVLFGVDFTVDDGEMVALLGTNGAGKSTLLRVISGIGLPQRGTVRLAGAEITFLDAERRVGLGVTQIPGGKAVFGALNVVDNMRVYGFSHGANRAAVERGIEESFARFPRLGERRDQLASTLSGGEQQMLALSKAFIVKPRLLLIDELSLGLAPRVVGELLEMVKLINANGTAVVLVEQSVNIALSTVDHAYFMEKGEMRFDGKAKDLLGRDDLLRSVFLEGATKGLAR